jgi:hypothetical protein
MVVGGDEAWTFLEGAAGTSAGDSIAFVSDVVTVPSSNPTGGVYLYSEADTLYIRDTGGTVTDLTAGGFTPTDIDTDYGDETVTSTWQFNDTADNEWSPLTDDLTVGDDVDEGQIKIGNMVIGQADDTVSTTVLDDIGILYNNSDSIEDIGFMFVSAADIPRFVLAEEGADLATYNPRSMVIGPAATMANVDENIICSTNFDDIDCDTGATGADLGVEDDLELGGIIYGSAADGDTFSTALTFTTATADRTATVPNADSAMAQAVACGGTDKVSSFNVSTGAFTCTADQDSGGTPAWEALVNTADTPTDYTSDNTAEVVGFDFESAFTTGTQFLIRQQTGTPSGGTLFGITNNDADVTPFEIDVDGGGAEFTFDSGGHFVLPSVNDAATPTLAFGGDSGFYEIASNIVGISIGGTGKFQIFTNTISGLSNSSGALINETTSATNPTLLSRSGDLNTGLGSNAADQLSLIGNAHEMMRLGNDGTDTLVEIKADATEQRPDDAHPSRFQRCSRVSQYRRDSG